MTFLFFQYIYNHITPYPVLLLWQATAFPAEYLSRIIGQKEFLELSCYTRNKNYLRSETEEKRNERFARQDRIKQLLNECPHIEMWMSSHYSILRGSSICMLLNDQDTRQPMLTLFPSPQFFQLYDLKVLEGRNPPKI